MTARFGVHHLGLVVDDLDRAERFYGEAFGFTATGRTEWTTMPGHPLGIDAPLVELRWVFLSLDRTALELHEYRGLPKAGTGRETHHLGLGHVAFAVDDMNAAVAELSRAGVEFFTSPNLLTDSPGQEGDSWVYGRDPFGLTIELYSTASLASRDQRVLSAEGIHS